MMANGGPMSSMSLGTTGIARIKYQVLVEKEA